MSTETPPSDVAAHSHPARRGWIKIVIAIVVLAIVLFLAIPWFLDSLKTVSTDDAYVNGHVTFVAARVPGQVQHVLVDDNNHVHKGDLLMQLDKSPYQVQADIAAAAVAAAESDFVASQAQVRGMEAQARSARWNLERSIEDVDNQIAVLRSRAATLASKKAALTRAQADYDRAASLVTTGAVAKEELDARKEALSVSQAQVEEALQGVYQVRVALGLPPKPETGDDLTQVPSDLDQTFAAVRQAQANLFGAAAQLGVYDSFNVTPKEMLANFYKRDPSGDIDKIYAQLLVDAPPIKQAQAKLKQAQANLEQAKLNLSYTDIVAEIDGVVTRRSVNPGNNVVAGQDVMGLRSLTDIWIDANFKETQLGDLRIGQVADLYVDMYGKQQMFKGRITGFTMGTGSTLALLPAENATGNFVKVVQRLPVRIDLIDYDPEKAPLFIGLSVTPKIHLDQAASGPDAGKILQPYLPAMPATQPAMDGTADLSLGRSGQALSTQPETRR